MHWHSLSLSLSLSLSSWISDETHSSSSFVLQRSPCTQCCSVCSTFGAIVSSSSPCPFVVGEILFSACKHTHCSILSLSCSRSFLLYLFRRRHFFFLASLQQQQQRSCHAAVRTRPLAVTDWLRPARRRARRTARRTAKGGGWRECVVPRLRSLPSIKGEPSDSRGAE